MRIPKRYGQSQIARCPFCDSVATASNKQRFPVCSKHKDSEVGSIKCSCGSWLDMKQGPYGTFFLCFKCGPMNLNKILAMNGGRLG
ncbi:hypothetical protein J4219_09035 [Candidatus Woesearchaeota archaeon]|nr:hypothetical protein [Candidatus Woesearchaeota archaeon]